MRQPLTILMDQRSAEQAWLLYQALMQAARQEPRLLDDPLFQVFRAEAYERFEHAFTVLP